MKFLILIIIFFLHHCGVNTDTSVSPFIFLIPPATPEISHILPINENYDDNYNTVNLLVSPKPEYLLQYYVTNIEPQYVGNNVYITSTTPSVAETYNNLNSSLYLINGTQPSFAESPFKASNTILISHRIEYKTPPPGITNLQKCEIYTFALRAVLNTGVISQQSVPVSSCASMSPSSCPTGSGCNPDFCNVSSCGSPASCPVGTLCNPCKITGRGLTGCPCPSGVYPPGCN